MRLMLISSICTLLTAVVAVFYILFSFFFQKTQQDIEYVLDSTTTQYQSYMTFIEDGQISIRRNVMLEDFFSGNDYDEESATSQLSYCMNLYAERNIVDRQLPFVTGVYLFNNQDRCISECYYASTLASEMEEERQFRTMHEWFSEKSNLYSSSADDDSIYYYFRLYDDNMEEKGICITQVSRLAMEFVLSEVLNYDNSFWLISAENAGCLAYKGDDRYEKELEGMDFIWNGKEQIGDTSLIGSATSCVYGTKLMLAVGRENIFSILQPTLVVLSLEILLVFAIALLISYGASSRFLKPVTKMMKTIRDFGQQNFAVRVADSEIQEFQDIGNVFNEMADNIEHLITDVYEKQLLVTQSQVKYLQAQINPHFQFNILSMLSLKAKMAGNEEVYEGLRAFSKLTQGKIFREKEIKIKVSEELEIVNFYLYLQKSRYGDKLSYDIHLDQQDINDYLIPRLLIEPLVENAVSHGLEPKRSNGHIGVELMEKGEQLCISVEDDGVGADDSQLELKEASKENSPSHTGTSLENTKRMLQILYGDKCSIDFLSQKDIGTKVEIMIPIERG